MENYKYSINNRIPSFKSLNIPSGDVDTAEGQNKDIILQNIREGLEEEHRVLR